MWSHGLMVVLLFAAVLPLALLCVRQLRAHRREHLRAVAVSLGCSFHAVPSQEAVDLFKPFRLWVFGFDQRIANLFHGRLDGFEVYVCDFGFTIGTISPKGPNQLRITRTPVLLKSAEAQFPRFQVIPKCAEKAGRELSCASHVDVGDARLCMDASSDYRALPSAVLAWLSRFRLLNVEAGGDSLLLYEEADCALAAEDVRPMIDRALELARLLTQQREQAVSS